MSLAEQDQWHEEIPEMQSVPDAKACAVLVEKVFPPQSSTPREQVASEAAFLPHLLNRAMAIWSDDKPSLNSQIQSLRTQKVAAAQLLDVIEMEAEQIEQRLHEKSRQAKLQQSKGLFPWANCGSCGSHFDSDELSFQRGLAANKENMLELRPVLRNQLKEYEQTLLERDTELRQLRHELDLIRCEKDARTQDEKDALLDPVVDAKKALLQRYSASFSLMEGTQLKNVFLVWRHYAHQRTVRSKMLKRASLSLSSSASQRVALIFSNWHSLVREKKQAQMMAQKMRKQAVAQNYTAKLLMQSDSATLRAIVIGWWRCSKEAALQKRLEAVHAERRAAQQAAAATTSLAPAAHPEKACCSLM